MYYSAYGTYNTAVCLSVESLEPVVSCSLLRNFLYLCVCLFWMFRCFVRVGPPRFLLSSSEMHSPTERSLRTRPDADI